jgi:predicted RNase H-like HicB family nuclease
MAHYIALIHKDVDSSYGVSFPDVPGVFTAGDTIDEAIEKAAQVLECAAGDWSDLKGDLFPAPRTIGALRAERDFQERGEGRHSCRRSIPREEGGRLTGFRCAAISLPRPSQARCSSKSPAQWSGTRR